MMKVLIIGSKGFIGSHCVQYFRNNGNIVHECDVAVDYTAENYIQVDATNADYSEIFRMNDFDCCINCSGAASVPQSIENPYRDFVLNTANVVAILDSIRKYSPYCKFLNLSTAAVYGNPGTLPINEKQKLNPISPYGIHKKHAEELCTMYADSFGLRTCSARIFSAYGPGLKKQLFWDVAKKCKEKGEVVFFGTGNESRDFIYIDDLIFAFECIVRNSAFTGECVNVANGEEIMIKNAIGIFLKILKWEGEYSFSGEGRRGDPVNWKADISMLRSFGYNSRVTIEKGLAEYNKWLGEKR